MGNTSFWLGKVAVTGLSTDEKVPKSNQTLQSPCWMMSIQNLSMYLAFFCFFFSNKTWMQHQCLHRYNNTGVSWRWGRWWCVASWSTITLQPEWICLLLQQKTVREVFTSLFVKRCFFFGTKFFGLDWGFNLVSCWIFSLRHFLKDVKNRKLDHIFL